MDTVTPTAALPTSTPSRNAFCHGLGRLAPPEQRASVMSAFYIVAYAGVALPVLAVGVGADWVGLPTAVSTLAVAVTVTTLSLVVRLFRPHQVSTIRGP